MRCCSSCAIVLAVTFGIWAGLSLWFVPTLLGLFFAIWLALGRVSGMAVLLGLACLLPAFLLLDAPRIWYPVWLANTVILAWTHRHDLLRVSSAELE